MDIRYSGAVIEKVGAERMMEERVLKL